jgi:hypothetical protein
MNRRSRSIARTLAFATLLAVAFPAAISASDRPPQATERRPIIGGVFFGTWTVTNGRMACEQGGSECMVVFWGSVSVALPVPAPNAW